MNKVSQRSPRGIRVKRMLSTGLVAVAVGVGTMVVSSTPAAAAELQKARVFEEFSYSQWCWEQPGETHLQLKLSGTWTTVATAPVAQDESCEDPNFPYLATLNWVPDRSGTYKAREYRPATTEGEAQSMPFTLKIADPKPIKVKLGQRFTYDYCFSDPGDLKLQVKSGGRWKTVDTTTPVADGDMCQDPEFPYSGTMTWKPSKTGTFTVRDHQSATATTVAGSNGSLLVKVTRPTRSGGESPTSDYGVGGGGAGSTTGLCNDGWLSNSIGKSGACSHHGGVSGVSTSYSSSIASTYVSGYYRSNGTYVSGYYRR